MNTKPITEAFFQMLDGIESHPDRQHLNLEAVQVGAIVWNEKQKANNSLLLVRDEDGDPMPVWAERGVMETLAEVIR